MEGKKKSDFALLYEMVSRYAEYYLLVTSLVSEKKIVFVDSLAYMRYLKSVSDLQRYAKAAIDTLYKSDGGEDE